MNVSKPLLLLWQSLSILFHHDLRKGCANLLYRSDHLSHLKTSASSQSFLLKISTKIYKVIKKFLNATTSQKWLIPLYTYTRKKLEIKMLFWSRLMVHFPLSSFVLQWLLILTHLISPSSICCVILVMSVLLSSNFSQYYLAITSV